MTIDKYVILAIIWMDVGALALQCYSCQGTNDTSQCQTTACPEVCFKLKLASASGDSFAMGCASLQECSGSAPHHGGAGIVGRSVLGDCHECCSSDYCNFALCDHLDPSACVDDEAYDCAKLQSIYDICNGDAETAAETCPHFCNLCNYQPMVIKLDIKVGPGQQMTQIDFRGRRAKGHEQSDLYLDMVNKAFSSDISTMNVKLDMEAGHDQLMVPIEFRSHWIIGQGHSNLECENVV
ncbi:uncharacterized protein LOC128210818 [Mya arenaria]|uniref:uncharacterized protein LOC128210818 n=1 Tax=Mya arenaria TaxID=6604 RepID=UPI0022DF7D31|nr:uncharacterized protein LOC128210818 [Mya arenaria]